MRKVRPPRSVSVSQARLRPASSRAVASARSRAAGSSPEAARLHRTRSSSTSPKTRSVETARLACEPLGVEPAVHEPLRSGFDRDEALALLHAAGGDRRVLVVGHEPDFSQVVHDLTGARIDLKKGGIAAIRLESGARGELVALLRPRELDRIGA